MGKFRIGNRNASKKIRDQDIPAILTRRANNESYASIARDYDVIPLTIARICNGESRRDVTKGQIEEALLEFATPLSPEDVARAEAAFREAMDNNTITAVPERIDYMAVMERRAASLPDIDKREDMIDKQEK